MISTGGTTRCEKRRCPLRLMTRNPKKGITEMSGRGGARGASARGDYARGGGMRGRGGQAQFLRRTPQSSMFATQAAKNVLAARGNAYVEGGDQRYRRPVYVPEGYQLTPIHETPPKRTRFEDDTDGTFGENYISEVQATTPSTSSLLDPNANASSSSHNILEEEFEIETTPVGTVDRSPEDYTKIYSSDKQVSLTGVYKSFIDGKEREGLASSMKSMENRTSHCFRPIDISEVLALKEVPMEEGWKRLVEFTAASIAINNRELSRMHLAMREKRKQKGSEKPSALIEVYFAKNELRNMSEENFEVEFPLPNQEMKKLDMRKEILNQRITEQTTPLYDLLTSVVYSCARSTVSDMHLYSARVAQRNAGLIQLPDTWIEKVVDIFWIATSMERKVEEEDKVVTRSTMMYTTRMQLASLFEKKRYEQKKITAQ